MKRVRILVPEVKGEVERRPMRCKRCGGRILQGHGRVRKRVKDVKVEEVEARRYRCTRCKSTFRHYPEGVNRAQQSRRTVALAALLWGMGLSHGHVSLFLKALGCSISRMTSWRDVQQLGGVVRRKMSRLMGRIQVIGVDETVERVKGREVVVGFVVDVERGETLGIDILIKQDAPSFLGWLRRYVEALGVKVMVSDDLSTYKPVVEELGLEHQVGLAHVRKNLTRRLKAMVKALPAQGGKELLSMEKGVRAEPALRDLVVDTMERWPTLRCHQRLKGVPATNNATQRAIARSKIRYKTLRSYKSMEGMLNGTYFTQWLHRPRHIINLKGLLPN